MFADESKRTAARGREAWRCRRRRRVCVSWTTPRRAFSSPRRRRRPRTSIRGCRARRGVARRRRRHRRGLPNNGVDADVAPKGVAFFSVSVAPPPAMLIVSFDSTLAPATAATHRAPRSARLCARRPPFVRLAASARTARTRRRSNRTIHPTPLEAPPRSFSPFSTSSAPKIRVAFSPRAPT